MAHNVETMAYAGETPWHGLGIPVPADLTPAQMQEAAGLDWTVGKSDLFYTVGDRQVRAGKKQALIRESDGRMLDVVSEDWTPVQNEQAFEFFNDFCAAGDRPSAGIVMVWNDPMFSSPSLLEVFSITPLYSLIVPSAASL